MKYLKGLFILLAVFLMGCSQEDTLDEMVQKSAYNRASSRFQNIVDITSYGTRPVQLKESSDFENNNIKNVRAVNQKQSADFETAVEFESSESVVLPHLQRYIYPGSLLMGNSIQDLSFKPISAKINPVTVSLSIPATNYETGFVMEKPSLSALRELVNNYLRTATFSQNGQLSYSIEKFSSYDELKVAFGTDIETRGLFNKHSTSEDQYGYMVSKRNGFYIKFYQTSFTLDMDLPEKSLVQDQNFDDGGVEPVYVSSIAYGRMGILTIETDELSEKSLRVINSSFNTIFKNGSSTLTEEEKRFFNGADLKLLLIGGNGNTAVQSFKGYEAFVEHISQGTFSKSSPGVPIFCSYAYLKDNSPVKTTFKFNIKKRPLYVELIKENVRTNQDRTKVCDLRLKYYESRSKIPTIASPYYKIKVVKKTSSRQRPSRHAGFGESTVKEEVIIKQNTLMQTSTTIVNQTLYSCQGLYIPKGRQTEFLKMSENNIDYYISEDEDINYIPIN